MEGTVDISEISKQQKSISVTANCTAKTDANAGAVHSLAAQYSEERDVNFLWGTTLSPARLQLVDRLAFAAGVILVWCTSAWLSGDKSTFHYLYAALSSVVLTVRLFEYTADGRLPYFLDLCYLANFMFIGFCAIPSLRHPLLYQCLFAWICGPTSWQMIVIKNELVFHSWDRMVSMFIHWYPAVAMWVVRWHTTCEFWDTCDEAGKHEAMWSAVTFTQLVVHPMGWYMVWMAAWCLIVFVLAAPVIKKYQLRTVYHWMMLQKDHPFTQVALKLRPKVRPLLYLSAHFSACCYAITFSYLLWNSYVLHSAFLIMASLICLWHGTGFFFGIFVQNYLEVTGLNSPVVHVWADKTK